MVEQSTLLKDQNEILKQLSKKIELLGQQQKQEQSQPTTSTPLVFWSLLGIYDWKELQGKGEDHFKEGQYSDAYDRFCNAIKSAQTQKTADLSDVFNLYVLAAKCQGYKFFNFMKPSLPVATGMILGYRVIKYFEW